MSPSRQAALALAAGTLAGWLVMLAHPTGASVAESATRGHASLLAPAVHWLALVAQPFLLAGALALVPLLAARRPLALLGYAFFALGVFASLGALLASGFVGPAVLRGLRDADAGARALIAAQLRYTWYLNQAFAGAYAVCTALAILTWSLAARATRALPAYATALGAALGAAIPLLVATRHVRLDVHGFGLVVGLEGIWLLLVAARLWGRGKPAG